MYNSVPLDILAGESSPKQRESYVINLCLNRGERSVGRCLWGPARVHEKSYELATEENPPYGIFFAKVEIATYILTSAQFETDRQGRFLLNSMFLHCYVN